MTATLYPTSEHELAEMVVSAADAGTPLAVVGGGTRGAIGGHVEGLPISTSGFTGITLYEPAEMVISARAGTPVAEIEATLAQQGQVLAFEPMDHRPLLGRDGAPTIGALAAANISGPRRISVGAARDHLIGVRLVNGQGEVIKSGGRVMKNVTGLDLVKLSAGAFGTLGILSEVTFKVMPRPETAMTLCIESLAAELACDALTSAMGTPFDVSAAAFLPSEGAAAPSRTLFRIEGFSESCAYRFERLATHLAPFGAAQRIEGQDSTAIWADIRDASAFADPAFAHLLRVHIAPSKAARFVSGLSAHPVSLAVDWGGGLIWLGLSGEADVDAIIALSVAAGGYPMTVRSTDARLAYAPPASAALRAVAGRVKNALDPKGIFNPGLLAGQY